MKRVDLLKILLIGSPATLTGVLCSGQEQKPSIVFILADDMGWGDINANGNSKIETPALNRLANQSLSFDRFYVCPLSAPTRAEMLTGRYFQQHPNRQGFDEFTGFCVGHLGYYFDALFLQNDAGLIKAIRLTRQ